MKKYWALIIVLITTIRLVEGQGENLVQNGTFEEGNVGFKSDFRFELTRRLRAGDYGVIDRTDSLYAVTPSKIGHGEGPFTGFFLAVAVNKGVSGKQRLWYDSITIKPNTTYSFSCLVANIYYNSQDLHEYLGAMQLFVNEEKVCKLLIPRIYWRWSTLSGTFTSGPDQTRIEISIQDWIWFSAVAVDNIVFKEIQAGEYEKEFAKKEERFPKLGDKGGLVIINPPPVKKEEPVVIPPLVKEEPVIEIPPVKEEEPVVEIPPVKEEEPIVETPPIKEEEPIVVILPKPKPAVVVPPKTKPPIVIPPKPKPSLAVAPKLKVPVVVPPKPRPPVVVPPKSKPPVVVPPKSVKKDTATQLVAVSADFKKDISIDEIKVDQKLQLSHIYFERAQYNLLETSLPELNNLTTFMKKHPTVRIKLEGHTDNQGDHKLNVVLSENRVKEVKKYLVEQGISDNRIEWIGYGGQRSTNSNSTEYLRQKNRRVEVVIIGK